MGNSTKTIQYFSDYASTYPDLKTVLATGGVSQSIAVAIATDTVNAMIYGFPWKWNRFKLPLVYTNSWQQDYAVPGLVNLGRLEHGVSIDINNLSPLKPIWPLEVDRDLEMTSTNYAVPGQASWLPNDQLVYSTWAASTTFGQLLNVPSAPANPIMQIQDPNGNFWVVTNNLTQSVTTGTVQPTWPTNPVFPTPLNPNIVATTVTDGTVVWTAVNPKGQGIRLNPIPPQTGVVYQLNLIGQALPPQYTNLRNTIEPVPDADSNHFRAGFIAYAHLHSKDPEVRGKFQDLYNIWIKSLEIEKAKHDLEKDATGMYPSEGSMSAPMTSYIGPANPYWPGGF